MPKRTDIETILVIGAGPIVIGQACEFDYSGTQACKALKEEGYRVVLVNSNPATIMTDPDLAHATFIEPITKQFVTQIIQQEKPCALLPTMGGQTALNIALELKRDGTLERFNVELIGARADAIQKAENRGLFQKTMHDIGLETPRAKLAHHIDEVGAILDDIGLPAIIRPSFTLSGWGGGIAKNEDEYMQIAKAGLAASPENEILIEESVLGWKEYEMEVVRDKKDNAIIICSIENIDPMGIHTGDSITIAPALTLSDKEYQMMRQASLACLRAIGVETGGSNVQFAINPKNGRMVIIEMNPRVSRSSALASKATGFPIAKIAAKLAIGYQLDELANDMTGSTPASFEPVIDYIVTKIPRFAFEKFPPANGLLSTSMQSVGEVMAIGRSFAESFQKALRSLETGLDGLDEQTNDIAFIKTRLAQPRPDRLLLIADGLRHGLSPQHIHQLTQIDPWFIDQIAILVAMEKEIQKNGLPQNEDEMRHIKAAGFSDARLATLTNQSKAQIANIRKKLNITPIYKRVDSCAAEFAAQTSYMYGCYDEECESDPSDKRKVIILGGGPNRIGQGIEFDYCCCHASFALAQAGIESIMVNCNPETVSTDYDISDRLYFEPLSDEDVLNIIDRETANGEILGVILQFGGQTPLKLAKAIKDANIPILGTSPDNIDLAEDRERLQKKIQQLGLKQPHNGTAASFDEASALARLIGYPIIARPSYVLGGRAMEIIRSQEELKTYFDEVFDLVQGDIFIDAYLADAIEVDVDALGDGEDAVVCGIMEHIEEAGVHSGDSACALPPFTLSPAIIAKLEKQTLILARALNVKGLVNIQYAILDDEIYILEINPRASRTVPFVAKAIDVPIVKMAVALMLGAKIKDLPSFDLHSNHGFAVKEAVFPFHRFPNMDVILGPEMRSTGEVMGLAPDFATAFAKSQIACGLNLPCKGCVLISVKSQDKAHFLELARQLAELGFEIKATKGTADYFNQNGVQTKPINKMIEGSPHIGDAIEKQQIQLIFNTTQGAQSIADSRSLRRAGLMASIPYYTTLSGARACVQAIKSLAHQSLPITSLQNRLKRKL